MILLLIALASAIIVGFLVVYLRDAVYSSLALAVLGLTTASILALQGYSFPAIMIVLVYVGSAVMLFILSVSMIGGVEREPRNVRRGIVAGFSSFILSLIICLESKEAIESLSTSVFSFTIRDVSDMLLTEHPQVLLLIVVSLLATAIEGILILRSWGERGG